MRGHLVTVHSPSGFTMEGRVSWEHPDGTVTLDRRGFLRRMGTARIVRTTVGAIIHDARVRPLPCCGKDPA